MLRFKIVILCNVLIFTCFGAENNLQRQLLQRQLIIEKYISNNNIKIDPYNLKRLIKADQLIVKNSSMENKRELYDLIQNILFKETRPSLESLLNLFIVSVHLDNELLINLFADFIAQIIIESFSKEILEIIVNYFKVTSNLPILRNNWYLIEKYYYLRTDQEPRYLPKRSVDDMIGNWIFGMSNKSLDNEMHKPNLNKIIVGFNKDLQDLLNIHTEQAKVDIINKWKLSINDLIDYDKITRIDEQTGILRYRLPSEFGYLYLDNFYLFSLEGSERILDVDKVFELDLSNNLIVDLKGDLKPFKFLRYLNLKTNKIKNMNPYEALPSTNIKINIEDNPLDTESKMLIVDYKNAPKQSVLKMSPPPWSKR